MAFSTISFLSPHLSFHLWPKKRVLQFDVERTLYLWFYPIQWRAAAVVVLEYSVHSFSFKTEL
jgi:hypothetical protein